MTLQGHGVEWVIPYLIHIGALCYFVCFLFRDQLWLRLFAVVGDLVYTAFYFTAADVPLWNAIVYSLMNMAINLVMIGLILQDRRMMPLDDNDLRLYQSFQGMTPGDFRRLRKIGKWHRPESSQTLTTEGANLEHLYFVVEGDVEIKKAGRHIPVSPGIFIGEVAYLKNAPASASVVAKPGTRYISWSHSDLKKIVSRHESLRQSLGHLLSADLAAKVANS